MRALFFVATLLLLALGGLILAWGRFSGYLSTPAASRGAEKVLEIGPDATPESVVRLLAHERLITDAEWLELYVDRFATRLTLKPGEYALAPTMSPVAILEKISSGKVVTYPVAIKPGSDVSDIAHALAAKGLGEEVELVRLARDPATASDLGVPGDGLEGYLFPDNYELPKHLGGRDLLAALVNRYHKFVTAETLAAARQHSLDEKALIILASLLEKSELPAVELRTYSAMLQNRLEDGIPLGSPASVMYGLKRMGITSREAAGADQLVHPWNTEKKRGLPPTPICSPSLASILAAAEPAASKARYMVERPDGTHMFCEEKNCGQPVEDEQASARPKRHSKKKRRR